MIRPLTLIIILLIIVQTGFSQVITVKQDGTGDYTTIQDALDAALSGSTIIVYTGIYYENIDFNGKSNITLASLYYYTPHDSLILQTVIDGNHNGSCILVNKHEQDIEINGFTIQNGIGFLNAYSTKGGGIYFLYAQALVKNCIITNNTAHHGGGVCAIKSNLYLSNTDIIDNHGFITGGGIRCIETTLLFDSINRCNMYLNYSVMGTDFAQSSLPYNDIIVDTATIIEPSKYYILSQDEEGLHEVSIDINYGKIVQLDTNLYVSLLGDDTNSGLTPEEPLKTIAYSMLKIKSDSIKSNTVYLDTGIYAPSTNGEKLLLLVKNNVPLVGKSREKTIIDAEHCYQLMRPISHEKKIIVKNLTMKNGNGDFYLRNFVFRFCNNILFDSIIIDHCHGKTVGTMHLYQCDTVTFINSHITHSKGNYNLKYLPRYSDNRDGFISFISCKINNNLPYIDEETRRGLALFLLGADSLTTNVKIINCEINENVDSTVNSYVYYNPALGATNNSNIYIINTTIGNNYTTNNFGSAIEVISDSKVYIYNSIIYGNRPPPAQMLFNYNTEAYVYNSLVENGQQGILLFNSSSLYYDPSNIHEDPMWDTAGMYPYSLSAGSPCIDAGTLDLPPGIELPETDLMGNPRVYGSSIDMGAYEWFPVGITEQNSKRQTAKEKLLKVSPNPFSYETYISYEAPDGGHVVIEVYDIQGRKQTTLMDTRQLPGSGEFYWAGNDDYNYPLRSGTYIIRLIIDEQVQETVKVVKK